MASSTTIVNDRKFIVKGQLKCLFTPDETEFSEEISNLTIELWQKSPLNIFILGNGRTDVDGNFVITFEVNDQTAFLTNDAIENVFAKVFYRGELISGENPYSDDEDSKRPIRNITLREGLTDIGTYEIEITQFEYPVDAPNSVVMEKPVTAQNSILFDIKEASSGQPLPTGYRCTFRGYISEEPNELTLFSVISDTTKEGYSELVVPQLPAVVKQVDEEFVINLNITGIPATPSQECYLRLYIGETVYCTQITNFVIHEGKLSVYSEGNYYYVHDFPENLEDVTIIGFSETGQTAYYHSITETWETNSGFVFYQMQYPENLTKVANGIYAPNERVGTIVSGQLGTESFSPFSLSVENQGVIPINVELRIEAPTKETIFFGSFTNLLPGSKNFVMVETDNFPAQPDESPTIGDIETISGVIFSVDFMNFLNSKGLTTLDKIKQAGPIRYIDGFPSGSIKENELAIIQGHVDLYTINASVEQNQHLINQGYDSLYKIAETPKDVFLNDMEGTPLFQAITIYEQVSQNFKLVGNLLSGKMNDLTLRSPYIPNIEVSNFAETAFSKFENRCKCEDCTSAVSPFSYMVDLLKYGAKHIKKTSSPSYSPVNYNAFLTLLENYFFQPFGSFAMTCSTLHTEYCRLRLVTEILEQYVATKTLPTEVTTRLAQDRKNFILLVYKTLLTQAGSSYEELRKIMSLQDEDERIAAAQHFSDKLEIPLYVPNEAPLLTAERMWLTFDTTDPDYELNAENLELIFGFRDTQRDVMTEPPTSFVSEWKNSYLFGLWKSVDFLFSAYSRENVDPDDDNTFKTAWKPIIDPDSFGRDDMTYLSSDFALALWRHRKADTDEFLNKFVTDSNVLSRTSVDMQGRKLRIPNKNLSAVKFADDKIWLKDPDDNSFKDFHVHLVEPNGANTDITLKQSTINSTPPVIENDLFQPAGNEPIMRYDSIVEPTSVSMSDSSVNVELNWEEATILNYLDIASGGTLTLTSSGAPEIYTTEDHTIDDQTIVIEPELNKISFSLDANPSTEFIGGNITLTYTAEVEIDTTTIPSPDKICTKLFGTYTYTYLTPAPSGMGLSYTHTIWDEPATWPSPIDAGLSQYEKLKSLYEIIRSGNMEDQYLSLITDNFHTDLYGFNLVMETLITCENYLESMYSVEKPNWEKLCAMASVFRNSFKQSVSENWVKEEIKHIPSGGTEPEKLMLDAHLFWNALQEPQTGLWDSSLQTIPDIVGAINRTHIPIIDPERVAKERLLLAPDAKLYNSLYTIRQEQLDNQRADYFSWLVPFNVEAFKQILNHINTGDKNEDYDLEPEYEDLAKLIDDFNNTDAFKRNKAVMVLEDAFALSADAFSTILPVMNAYQSNNPSQRPNTVELRAVTDLFVTAFKRKQLYFTGDLGTGWIEEEVTGTFSGGNNELVKYYNVLNMTLDNVRGSRQNRTEWQRTLAEWNRVPTVFPDIVPPENINRFIQGEIVHDLWINRKNTLDNAYNQANLAFNDTLDVDSLFTSFKALLSAIALRTQTPPVTDYSDYITVLFDKEDNGEDIRPYLNQLTIFIGEYRVLRQVYEVLESEYNDDPMTNSNLLPSEYEDVNNIGVRINFANSGTYFSYVNEEYSENIVLSGADFQNYKPSEINFPLILVQEIAQWRSPLADKKAWKDTLEARINRKQNVLDDWETVLGNTEDTTMSVMRDALIQALRNNCESFEDTAERLARTLFIETKDNCCMKHSRVSHAIETLQGLIFALENGIYDDYLNGFSLVAPNFKKEWEWIGSYATWRSAVFVYLYPENLLYPTLKKRQSPAFIELSDTLLNANRFSALDTCRAAKKYQDYFEDIQNLKIICTANTHAYVYRKDPADCCGDLNNSMQEYMTYYIAQSTLSGKGYYSEKAFYANSDEHDFWKEIPTLKDGATIIGCLPLNREYDDNGEATKSALWLFYTYKEDGDLKLAYLKKDLMTAGSDWGEEETVDLPDLKDLSYRSADNTDDLIHHLSNSSNIHLNNIIFPWDTLTDITICQNSHDWDFVYFLLKFNRTDGTIRYVHVRYMAQEDWFDNTIGSMVFFDSNERLLSSLVHWIQPEVTGLNHLIGITVAFENELQTAFYGSLNQTVHDNYHFNHIHIPSLALEPYKEIYPNMVGVFKQNDTDEKFVTSALNQQGQTEYTEIEFTYEILPFTGVYQLTNHKDDLTTSGHAQHILSIAPRFNYSLWEGGSAVMAYSNNDNTGVAFRTSGGGVPTETTTMEFVLAPEKGVQVAIESGDCIQNFNIRTANIKDHLRANLNAPLGNPANPLYRTSTIREVLYEAYYFIPMLLALDQQQRGDYPTALAWYRSVYDYTANITAKRKIFYGLVMEQSVMNVYDRPENWLLDPLNPHLIAQTRTNAYTKYTLMNIIQCMLSYADREFTIDTVETVPNARKLYSTALDLLKSSELAVKPSKCYTTSHSCLQTAVTATIESDWNNSFSLLQNQLEKYGDVGQIETAMGEVATILNDDESSMEERFTDAFTYLATPPVFVGETSNTVSDFMDGIGERMNDAYRYLLANVPTQSFNETVRARLTVTLASMTGQIPETVSQPRNTTKINWLKEPVPNNSQPLDFQFINAEGQQLLNSEQFAYNPMHPSVLAFQTNLVFSNATILYDSFLYEEDFTPFIDYAFCLPSNPVYGALELKANLELFKIFNCRNIAGMERSLDIFAAPTDSVTGVPVIGAGGNLVLPTQGAIIPSQYRFRVLIERAKQLVAQAQQLESQFLATMEKEDAENYSQLRARQDLQTAKATVKLQDLRVKQSEMEQEVATLQRDKALKVQETYTNWLNEGLNGYEIASLALLSVSAAINAGTSIYMALGDVVGVLNAIAEAASSSSNIMSQLASYQRRQQEWQFQSELAGFDVSIANQQIQISQQNTRIVSQEREIASLNMSHATDALEFLKTKFTNAELYRWMGNVLERTYSYMLNLSTAVAKTAEQQYAFEQQQQSAAFILDDYWTLPQTGAMALSGGGVDRRGLTGSARLLQDITRLDQYAFDTTKRKLQMTKVISIGQLFPDAFQTFQETGVLKFDLTNRLFDYDFPGHYLRLINGVKISVVGLIPVYDNIKATLTASTTSYTVISTNYMFQKIPIRRLEAEKVALTAANRATGLFEFQQAQGELLNPFEGMGVESRWEFKMPKFSNRMDYGNIADVLVEIDYTALDSDQYRMQVLQDIDNTLGFSRGFSFRNNFTDQWYELQQAVEGTDYLSVDIEIKREDFAQGMDNIRLDGSNLLLHFVRKDGFTDEIDIVDFNLVLDNVQNQQAFGGQTINGTFKANALSGVLNTQKPATPFVKLHLMFKNTPLNRELFSQEKVMDILLLMNCKADLPIYPM